jgi:hypothetical protein
VIWLAREPMDMRAGIQTALGRVVKGFGQSALVLGQPRQHIAEAGVIPLL